MKFNIVERVKAMRRHVSTRVSPYRALLLALSGGMDSMVLLDILSVLYEDNNLNNSDRKPILRAIYVHHALSRYADEWASHCKKECLRRGIAFTIKHAAVNITSNGIEAAARSVRYQALEKALSYNEVLLTAHHQNDQAETLLLALKRGSGPAGLSAMAADLSYLGHRLVRPLLDFNREELELYAKTQHLHWIEDDSNTDLRFDRNFLRLCILPPLCQRWPKFIKTVARSAQLCAEQEQLIDKLLEETLASIIAPDGSLRLTTLKTMNENKRSALLRRWLANLGVKMPKRVQLIHLWKEVALSRRDAIAQFNLDNRLIMRFRDCLYVVSRLPSFKDKQIYFPWPKESEYLALPSGLGKLYRRQFDLSSLLPEKSCISVIKGELQKNNTSFFSSIDHVININIEINNNHYNIINCNNSTAFKLTVVRAPSSDEQVSVRFCPVHGLLYIVGRSRGRKLKKIWQELNIPPWRRKYTPLLFYNDKLIAALGVFVTLEGKVRENYTQWHLFLTSEQ
ncbi:tRNA(Ile)-lysidine synthase [Candidatus Gullanella endobia]|uniref:tRNA(Ile)-lysidine synthase n=1 Tax=Candidatus Gullanella endobia TaxID=1070130 RepID=A0A143WPU8_9ENTR|nr:tRNA lysidine(34) synthetase TilS [Candidatus Gullanella endobia]CUX95816.1 tRNA(Ile)-lysidine synthase [Candidatus Gullanella endobia]